MADDTLDLVPFHSLGKLTLGDGRARTQELLGSTPRSISKSLDGRMNVDAYRDLGLLLHFDTENKLEYVEAVLPARPSFRGFTLLGKDLNEVLEQLKSIGLEGRREDSDIYFDAYGFCLNLNAEEAPDGVSIWTRGYYDSPPPGLSSFLQS